MLKEIIKFFIFVILAVFIWIIGVVMGYNLCPFT